MTRLIVYFDEKIVGALSYDKEERLSFQYDNAWLKFEQRFPLSLSLPLSETIHGHLETKSFFENLLPEGEIKETLSAHGKKSIRSDFGLLKEFGGDCAGAFKVLPEKVSLKKSTASKKELTVEKITKYLRENKSLTDVILNKEGGKFSLAGAQDKFAVIFEHNKIYLPMDGSPTTHIIKPHVRYFKATQDSPYNEFFCMKLAALVGLNVPEVDIIEGEYPLYIVERFDRVKKAKKVSRIHQQDFCQAQGVTSLKKYEVDGGPSFKANYHLLKNHSLNPIPDLNQLIKWLFFNLMIGNNDSHSKNLALVQKDEGLRLAPFYDLLSTSIYKELRDQKFSFFIGGQSEWHKLKRKHFDLLSKDLELKEDVILKIGLKLSSEVIKQLPKLIQEFDQRFQGPLTSKALEAEILKRVSFFSAIFKL